MWLHTDIEDKSAPSLCCLAHYVVILSMMISLHPQQKLKLQTFQTEPKKASYFQESPESNGLL